MRDLLIMARQDPDIQKIQKICAGFDIIQYLSSRRYLSDCYDAIKRDLQRFSYRSYSKIMGFGSTNYLHLICTGQRALSVKAAEKVAKAFALSSEKKKYLIKLACYESARVPVEREKLFSELVQLAKKSLPSEISKEELSYFTEWYHPVIREFVGLKDFKGDSKWISENLLAPVTPDQIEKSLKLLQHIGYIKFDPVEGTYYQSSRQVRTPKEVKGLAVSRYHQQMIDQGKEAILGVKAKRRDISAVTICVSKEIAEEIKLEVQKFRDLILRKSEQSDSGEQIYQMNIQWFPFTKEPERD